MSDLAYIDTETTGLDPRINQPYEVCIWRVLDGSQTFPKSFDLPHSLDNANTRGLEISNYFERGHGPRLPDRKTEADKSTMLRLLHKATLVGSNPSFDANMMQKYLGVAVWHHRFIDVSNVAMMVFDWYRPKGLFDIAQHLTGLGWEIPEPDHTAEGDVRVTKKVYEALRDIRANMVRADREAKRA